MHETVVGLCIPTVYTFNGQIQSTRIQTFAYINDAEINWNKSIEILCLLESRDYKSALSVYFPNFV